MDYSLLLCMLFIALGPVEQHVSAEYKVQTTLHTYQVAGQVEAVHCLVKCLIHGCAEPTSTYIGLA